MRLGTLLLGAVVSWFAAAPPVWPGAPIVWNAGEAEAVLGILEKLTRGESVTDADWHALFATEPYVRLKQREASMKRDFTDDEFREFVLSDALAARAAELRRTLEAWSGLDLDGPIRSAAAYLPGDATIRAKVYPVIKPRTNSFVFEVSTDPAIFLFLDPEVTPAELANTIAHELHHIGFGGTCPSDEAERALAALPEPRAWLLARLGAFGEGFAMLAAAGGPDVHPHAASPADDRERWDRDVAGAAESFGQIESFILGVLDGSLTGDERQQRFFSFYGEQGPWYTVGWLMATTIERELGRASLIEAFCDTRRLLPTYDRAARAHNARGGDTLPLWSDETLAAIGVAPPAASD